MYQRTIYLQLYIATVTKNKYRLKTLWFHPEITAQESQEFQIK